MSKQGIRWNITNVGRLKQALRCLGISVERNSCLESISIAGIIVRFEHFYFAPFLNPFCVTPSKIVVYNRWKMRTKTITIQQLLPGLAWGEMSVEIALPTVYSSCECLSPCWCHFSLQDLPRKECQFRYCIEHETFSLLNSNQTRWRLFSFDFWIWNEGLLIGWI